MSRAGPGRVVVGRRDRSARRSSERNFDRLDRDPQETCLALDAGGSGRLVPHAAWSFAAARETPMQARRAVIDWARSYVEDRAVLSDIALAITEAATNVVLHAYRDHSEPGKVTIKAEYLHDHVCFYVRDAGSGLAPRVDSPGPRPRARADRPGRRLRRRPRARGRRHRGRHALQRLARRLTSMQMRLLRTGEAGSAALELAISHALLTRVAEGELPSTLRIYRPRGDGGVRQARPAAAPATQAAVAAARDHGYEPVLRLPGGHAAAYHADSLGIDVVWALDDPAPAPTTASPPRGSGSRARCASARRRRARRRGAGRVLPGRLQRQRARAGEADRHGPAARARRRAARRLDRRRRRRRHPRRPARRLRRARLRVGRRPPRARVDEEVPGVTLDAVEAARHRGLRRPRAGGPGRRHPRPGPPARVTARALGTRARSGFLRVVLRGGLQLFRRAAGRSPSRSPARSGRLPARPACRARAPPGRSPSRGRSRRRRSRPSSRPRRASRGSACRRGSRPRPRRRRARAGSPARRSWRAWPDA